MSDGNETSHQPEMDESKRKQDEQKIRGEGGPRLNGRLAASAVGLVIGLAIMLALAVQSSGLHQDAQAARDEAGDGNRTADKTEVDDLMAHGGEPSPAAMIPVPESTPLITPQTQTSVPAAPKPPSRYAQWAQDKYMKALEAPEMVAAFHAGGTLQIPRAQSEDTNTALALNNFQSSSDSASSSSGVRLHPPASPFTVMAGSVIPAVLVSGINSDLPGPILAQVSQNVFDSGSGHSLLIPQGSRLIGAYRSAAAYGQSRVQIQWQRLIFPNTSSMDIPAMPGTDEAGYAGFRDQVDNHYARTFGTAALMSLISAGQAVGQMATFGGGAYGPLGYYQPNPLGMGAQMAGASASAQFGQVGQQMIQQGMSNGPTLEVRPGYQFNVMVTEDLIFPGPYKG